MAPICPYAPPKKRTHCDRCTQQWETMQQKLDYLIELMRDDTLRFPHHLSYLDALLYDPSSPTPPKHKDA